MLPNLIIKVSKKLFYRNMKLELQNIVIAWPYNYLCSSSMRELITQLIIFLNLSYYSRLRFIYSHWSISCSLHFLYFRFRKFHIYQTLFDKKVSIKLNPEIKMSGLNLNYVHIACILRDLAKMWRRRFRKKVAEHIPYKCCGADSAKIFRSLFAICCKNVLRRYYTTRN